jgi:hypothetical protein
MNKLSEQNHIDINAKISEIVNEIIIELDYNSFLYKAICKKYNIEDINE